MIVFVQTFWPHPGPRHPPFGSGRGDIEFAAVLAFLTSVAVSLVPESICWNLVGNKNKKVAASKNGNMCSMGP